MPNYDDVARDVISNLESHSDERYRKNIRVFVKTQFELLGVPNAQFTNVLKEFSTAHGDITTGDRIEIARRLIKSDILEAHWFGYWLIAKDEEALSHIVQNDLDWMADRMDNWAQVDSFAMQISGVAWRDGLITDAKVESWLQSDNPFVRRLAVVSTVPLNRAQPGDAPRTIAMCEKVVEDKHDTIVKGLSWALRELIKVDRIAVEDFLSRHEDRLAARVKREVRNKLTKGLKNPGKGKS
jgi:3-methyladenine DNA glycosylase AlkD